MVTSIPIFKIHASPGITKLYKLSSGRRPFPLRNPRTLSFLSEIVLSLL
jgi:hypothetical protein